MIWALYTLAAVACAEGNRLRFSRPRPRLDSVSIDVDSSAEYDISDRRATVDTNGGSPLLPHVAYVARRPLADRALDRTSTVLTTTTALTVITTAAAVPATVTVLVTFTNVQTVVLPPQVVATQTLFVTAPAPAPAPPQRRGIQVDALGAPAAAAPLNSSLAAIPAAGVDTVAQVLSALGKLINRVTVTSTATVLSRSTVTTTPTLVVTSVVSVVNTVTVPAASGSTLTVIATTFAASPALVPIPTPPTSSAIQLPVTTPSSPVVVGAAATQTRFLSTGVAAGIAGGVVILAILISLLIFFRCRSRAKKRAAANGSKGVNGRVISRGVVQEDEQRLLQVVSGPDGANEKSPVTAVAPAGSIRSSSSSRTQIEDDMDAATRDEMALKGAVDWNDKRPDSQAWYNADLERGDMRFPDAAGKDNERRASVAWDGADAQDDLQYPETAVVRDERRPSVEWDSEVPQVEASYAEMAIERSAQQQASNAQDTNTPQEGMQYPPAVMVRTDRRASETWYAGSATDSDSRGSPDSSPTSTSPTDSVRILFKLEDIEVKEDRERKKDGDKPGKKSGRKSKQKKYRHRSALPTPLSLGAAPMTLPPTEQVPEPMPRVEVATEYGRKTVTASEIIQAYNYELTQSRAMAQARTMAMARAQPAAPVQGGQGGGSRDNDEMPGFI